MYMSRFIFLLPLFIFSICVFKLCGSWSYMCDRSEHVKLKKNMATIDAITSWTTETKQKKNKWWFKNESYILSIWFIWAKTINADVMLSWVNYIVQWVSNGSKSVNKNSKRIKTKDGKRQTMKGTNETNLLKLMK